MLKFWEEVVSLDYDKSFAPVLSKVHPLEIVGMSTALDCLRELHAVEEEMSSQRILYGVALTLISVVSLVMNTLLLLILFNDAMDRFFRLHLLSAAFSGLVAVAPIFCALIPAIFFDLRLDDPTNIIISFTDTLGYLTLTMTTTAIAFDRFVFFLLPKLHKRLSDNSLIIGCFAAVPWVAAASMIIHMTFNGCHKRTDPYALTFTYSCRQVLLHNLR
ncbi:hypothetical protein Y032_0024g903 [Ancylostoma ceylanicum]|uniref:7TM GPCR serpentine receptor class x (Srx) domain-containing protein n=2 Tax=Ancylostoma ceylanicum TaxID=53326 RepID=A0A016UVR0_9BILA|nr:hypothetical protein Y032_0024g903 [Ancylostoma ceylanicum]